MDLLDGERRGREGGAQMLQERPVGRPEFNRCIAALGSCQCGLKHVGGEIVTAELLLDESRSLGHLMADLLGRE